MISIEALHSIFLSSTGVTTDSRNCPNGSLFFALKGDSFNGNDFAIQALEMGCSYAIVDEVCGTLAMNILVVDDVLLALQKLASYHRLKLGTPILAITGTNGKTTTKELVNSVVSASMKSIATEGNLNNHIGIYLLYY